MVGKDEQYIGRAESESSPQSISLRPPTLSKMRPMNGWLNPPTSAATDAATETALRLHPNSSLIGRTNTPNPLNGPTPIMAMNVPAATISQP